MLRARKETHVSLPIKCPWRPILAKIWMPPQILTELCSAKFHENLLSGFRVFICGQTNRQIAKLVKCSFANLGCENPKTVPLKIFVVPRLPVNSHSSRVIFTKSEDHRSIAVLLYTVSCVRLSYWMFWWQRFKWREFKYTAFLSLILTWILLSFRNQPDKGASVAFQK